jgi:hypothetical protein
MDVHDRLMRLVQDKDPSPTPTVLPTPTILVKATATRQVRTSLPATTEQAAKHPVPITRTPVAVQRRPEPESPFDSSACVSWAHRRPALTTFIEATAWKKRANTYLRASTDAAQDCVRELAALENAYDDAKQKWALQPFYWRWVSSPAGARELRAQVRSIHTQQTRCRQAETKLRTELAGVATSKTAAKERLAEQLLIRQRLTLQKGEVTAAMRNIREQASAANAQVGTGLGDLLFGSPSDRADKRKQIRLNKEHKLQSFKARRNDIEAEIRAVKTYEIWLKSLK